MIIIDYHQIAYATLLEHLASTKSAGMDLPTGRTLVLDTIRANVKKFKNTYGPEVVIAFDDDSYWRKGVFPYYKHNRHKSRDNSQFDWTALLKQLNTLKEEFQEHLPYKVLIIPGCEADDIIAALTFKHSSSEKVMIVSGDKDFRQLHINKNVHQYSPTLKQAIVEENPMMTLKEQIIRGDKGDGIPNILSPDNSFADKIRQKPIMEKKLIVWLNQDVDMFCTAEMKINYERNKSLIDLREIPKEIRTSIHTAYETRVVPSKAAFLNYLSASKLPLLFQVADDF